MKKPTSILNDFKDILIAGEGATGAMEYVIVTDGTATWNGWRYNVETSIGCLGNPPKKDFTWDGIKWKVAKIKKKPDHIVKKCNTITYHPGSAILRFPSFILNGKAG